MKRIALLWYACFGWLCAVGQNNIQQVEYFFNNDPGFGNGTAVVFGAPAAAITDLSFNADISSLSEGFNMLYVRARNDSGWSVAAIKPIYILSAASATVPNLTHLEYFFDDDPGVGNGINVPLGAPDTEITNLAFSVATDTLAAGFHLLGIRAKNANEMWSDAYVKSIFIISASSFTIPNITEVEYFIDDDPGYGNGVSVAISPDTQISNLAFNVETDTLSAGFHTLNVRAKNANEIWSDAFVKSIFVLPVTATLPSITQVEYFVDNDPGYGNGTVVPIGTTAPQITNLTFDVSTDTLAAGFHTLNVRAQDENGAWSDAYVKSIFVLGNGLTDINKLEYFFDEDPGFGQGIEVPVVAAASINNFSFSVVTDTLAQGFHTLTVRAQDAAGRWSIAYNKAIFITASNAVTLAALEYFFDVDPGVGNGTSIPVAPVISLDSIVVGANISALVVGPHRLYIRARDSNGVWSTTESYPFEACIQDEPAVGQALGLSYDSFIANWAAATDALTYQLDVSTDTLKTFLPGFNSKSLVVLRDTLESLVPLTQYQYRVRALGNDNCLSINSDTIYVRTNSTLVIDTEALKALYHQAGGTNWTNKTNWLSSALADNTWHGVTVVNENVVAVDLSNNNVVGAVPDSVLNISLLQRLNLTGNRVSYVPDFSGLPNIDTINVSNNKLDFGDLEYNTDVIGINFNNQKDIGEVDNDTVNVADAYAHSVQAGGSANQYQWKKNDTNISGATNPIYELPSFSKADQGMYQAIITSPLVPGLTLRSAPKTLVGVASISGVLLVNGTPATKGTVQLLKITSGGYDSIPVIPQPVSSNGTFTLSKILLEDYLLVGLADTNTYERALPTYVPSTAYWEEADTITLVANISGVQINSVFKPNDQLTGEGLLYGLVQEDDGLGGRGLGTRRVGGAGVSARRTQGTGRGNEVLEIVGYVFTNEQGEFSIAGLPPGNYVFNVQYPGYPMDQQTFIDFVIGATPLDEAVQVEATVEAGVIKVKQLIITQVFERVDYKADVFPNPSKGVVVVSFADEDTGRTLTLRDTHGKTLLTLAATVKENAVDFNTLEAGMYLLTVANNRGVQKIVKVVKN